MSHNLHSLVLLSSCEKHLLITAKYKSWKYGLRNKNIIVLIVVSRGDVKVYTVAHIVYLDRVFRGRGRSACRKGHTCIGNRVLSRVRTYVRAYKTRNEEMVGVINETKRERARGRELHINDSGDWNKILSVKRNNIYVLYCLFLPILYFNLPKIPFYTLIYMRKRERAHSL